MTVPTITFRGGLLEVLLPFALPPTARPGTASSAARVLIVAKNVLRFICGSPSLSVSIDEPPYHPKRSHRQEKSKDVIRLTPGATGSDTGASHFLARVEVL